MRDLFRLSDKVAVVVGGGLGMGETTALRLAEAGCHVAIVDIDQARADRVADEVRGFGRKSVAIAADVLDASTAAPTMERVEAELGPIDNLSTIVGQASVVDFLDITPEIWDLDHRRNLRYFFFYAQAAAAAMVRSGRGGSITAVASICGVNSGPQHSAYAAAKAGLINLTRSMAVELARHQIRVNAVAPGTMRTPRIEQSPTFANWEKRIEESLIPAKRLGDTDDVADAMVYLASDMAKYVTGSTLTVDGGFTAQWALGLDWAPSA